MERPASRPSSRAGVTAAAEGLCLACACCGQVICTADAIVRERVPLILKSAVYAYELNVLSVPAWCYSATELGGERFDIIRVAKVCLGGASSGRFLGTRRASGVKVADVESAPSNEHSWFPDFAYQALRCGGCSVPRLLGWAFTRDADCFQHRFGESDGFFGLILTRLRERQMRVRRTAGALRGLSASTVSGTGSSAAAAAALGHGAMPSQLIPSTLSTCVGISRSMVRHSVPASPSSSDSDDAEDFFQLQRRTRRRESELRVHQHASVNSARGIALPPSRPTFPTPRSFVTNARVGGKTQRPRAPALPRLNSKAIASRY